MRLLLLLITALMVTAPANAAENDLSYKHFKEIPILDQGRIKPLGAYARLRLKSFSGHEKQNNQSAAAWLAEALFDPATALERKIFHIDNDTLKTRLGINPDQDKFNLPELQAGLQKTREDIVALLQKDTGDLTKDQQDLLALHEKAIQYGQILRSFSMVLPLNIDVPEKYGLKTSGDLNLLDLQKAEKQLLDDLKSIIKRKGQNPKNYTADEKQIARLAFQIQQIKIGSQNGEKTNTEFRVLTDPKNENLSALMSPWEFTDLVHSTGLVANHTQFNNWLKLAHSYRSGNQNNWIALSRKLQNTSHKISAPRLKIELIYTAIKPYTLAMWLYVLSILTLITAALKPHNILKYIGLCTGITAFTLHISAIAARIFILARPPVGTLYESVLFVSAICALIGILLFKNKSLTTTIIGQTTALGLLLIAPIMLQSGDSLELLVAVLNTNFWLATHVIIITAGYGICILAACMAHVYLAGRTLDKPLESFDKLKNLTYKTSIAALLLTAVGTVLGGIWADQSWGRFWGWDPKENGALLIVLWLIWALHGKLSNKLKPLSFIASIAFLNIVVALSWFGVNLLGVGLHSYGFTSGLASGLATFCTLETIVIAWLFTAAHRKERRI